MAMQGSAGGGRLAGGFGGDGGDVKEYTGGGEGSPSILSGRAGLCVE